LGSTGNFTQLNKRLVERRGYIWRAALSRAEQVATIPDPTDAAHMQGMRAAALAACDYGTNVVKCAGELPQVPQQLLAQARLSARHGMSLDDIVRRYFAGYSVYGGAVIEEAQKSELPPHAVKQVMDRLAEGFDRILSAVATAYAEQLRERSRGNHRFKLIESLLAGDRVDGSELGYDFDQNHLGVIASAASATDLLRELGRRLDRQVLVVNRSDHEVWAWFGGRNQLRREDLDQALVRFWPKAGSLALGECQAGQAGWRLTYRQAMRAWHSATRSRGIVRYREVALSSAILENEDLVAFLRRSYLVPLMGGRGGRQSPLRETLRAYFKTGGNISSTAAALSVNRQTVKNRLHQVENRLGERISDCRVELECALRLEWHEPNAVQGL
jgi:hypothetical protein